MRNLYLQLLTSEHKKRKKNSKSVYHWIIIISLCIFKSISSISSFKNDEFKWNAKNIGKCYAFLYLFH